MRQFPKKVTQNLMVWSKMSKLATQEQLEEITFYKNRLYGRHKNVQIVGALDVIRLFCDLQLITSGSKLQKCAIELSKSFTNAIGAVVLKQYDNIVNKKITKTQMTKLVLAAVKRLRVGPKVKQELFLMQKTMVNDTESQIRGKFQQNNENM